jgi:hypothetical protein
MPRRNLHRQRLWDISGVVHNILLGPRPLDVEWQIIR